MKLEEAKKIVSTICNWQFVLMGVKERSEVEKLSQNYSLEEILKANSLVKGQNEKKRKLQEYNKKKGNKTKGISQQLILADRLICAVYTAMNFTPDGELVAIINDLGVGCVKIEKYD